jgi:sec-independent protein translocase protein TatA
MGLDNPLHLAFLVLLLLLVFGAKRLPEMGRSLGAGMRGFRESISGDASAAPGLAAPTNASSAEATASAAKGDDAGPSPEPAAAGGALTASR